MLLSMGHNIRHKSRFDASSSPYAPRGALLCEWSRHPTSVRVTTNNPTWMRTALARAAGTIAETSRSSVPSAAAG